MPKCVPTTMKCLIVLFPVDEGHPAMLGGLVLRMREGKSPYSTENMTSIC